MDSEGEYCSALVCGLETRYSKIIVRLRTQYSVGGRGVSEEVNYTSSNPVMMILNSTDLLVSEQQLIRRGLQISAHVTADQYTWNLDGCIKPLSGITLP